MKKSRTDQGLNLQQFNSYLNAEHSELSRKMEIKEIKHQNEYHGSEMSICAKNKPKFQFFNVLTQWISWKGVKVRWPPELMLVPYPPWFRRYKEAMPSCQSRLSLPGLSGATLTSFGLQICEHKWAGSKVAEYTILFYFICNLKIPKPLCSSDQRHSIFLAPANFS